MVLDPYIDSLPLLDYPGPHLIIISMQKSLTCERLSSLMIEFNFMAELRIRTYFLTRLVI